MPNRQAGRVRFQFKRNCFCVPSEFLVIPETCALGKTGPKWYFFQVRVKQLWTERLLLESLKRAHFDDFLSIPFFARRHTEM
jgi:hypothetical protein